MDVRIDRIPASAEAEPTTSQLTSEMTAAVPIDAMAVWQTVLAALMRAAFQNSLFMMTSLHDFEAPVDTV